MGLFRWTLLLGALAGCADLSGLSNLEVGDAGLDATADVVTDAPPLDAVSGDGVAPDLDGSVDVIVPPSKSYCSTIGSTYLFCADFDENDLDAGYAQGQPATWTSTAGAALDVTVAHSLPASARISELKPVRLLRYDVPPAQVPQLASLTVTAEVDLSASQSDEATLIAMQVDPTHVVDLTLLPAQAQQAPPVRIDERDPTDGGGVSMHSTNATLVRGTWVLVSLKVTSTLVSYKIGTATGSFLRSSASSFDAPFAILGFGVDWSGNFDDVVVTSN